MLARPTRGAEVNTGAKMLIRSLLGFERLVGKVVGGVY